MTSQKASQSQNSNKGKAKDKEPWNTQLATIIIRAFVGGGIGTIVAAFNSSDLPQRFLGFAIGSGVAPVVLAFTEPISKKSKQIAGQTSQSLIESAESRFQRWKGNLSETERKYLESLQAHCYALECEGFSGLMPRLALQDIFVPLKLAGRNSNRQDGASQIWSFLPPDDNNSLTVEEKRLAIIAKPGYGKTTLTRHLAYCFSSPNYETYQVKPLMPILLRFRDIYGQLQSEQEPKLESLAVKMIQGLPKGSEIGITEAWLTAEKLRKGNCLVMLDGLDEVPEGNRNRPLREIASQWAHYQMQRFPSLFILTSRPHGYNAAFFPTVRPLQILDFNNEQKRKFLDKWYQVERWQNKWDFLYRESLRKSEVDRLSEEQAREQSESEGKQAAKDLYEQIISNASINTELAVNPLLLTIIAATHQAFDSLPNRRTGLYRKMFGLLLEDRPKHRDTRLVIREAERNQAVLQKLAMRLSQKGDTQFRLAEAEQWIGNELQQVETDQPYSTRQFLQQIEQIAGLLVGGDSDLYEFAHKTFQEYLVAAEIRDHSPLQLIERLRKADWQPVEDWKEIFSFYSALTSADLLVDEVAKMPEGDKRRNTLVLLNRIVSTEKSKITPESRRKLDTWMLKVDLSSLNAEEAAMITLEQRFQKMIDLDAGISVTAGPITWNEYQQFLEAQSNGQFHSLAEPQVIDPEQLSEPVSGLSTVDQHWFCTWLATQASLQGEAVVYDYRLPTATQLQLARLDTNQFHVVRVILEPSYEKLVSLLASGAWVDADQETEKLMLQIRGKESREYLNTKDLEEFPCVDLAHIDQLWVKNSGGRFGFTVQKKIWQECGSPMEYNESWEKFGDRVGWRRDGEWLDYDELGPSLSSPDRGIFPFFSFFRSFCSGRMVSWSGVSGFRDLGGSSGSSVLFSRVKTCKL